MAIPPDWRDKAGKIHTGVAAGGTIAKESAKTAALRFEIVGALFEMPTHATLDEFRSKRFEMAARVDGRVA